MFISYCLWGGDLDFGLLKIWCNHLPSSKNGFSENYTPQYLDITFSPFLKVEV